MHHSALMSYVFCHWPWHSWCIGECFQDDVIKWRPFPRYWSFVRGIHWSPVNSPHKGQWRGALMFSLICVWINGWVNDGEVGDLRCHRAHYDVMIMSFEDKQFFTSIFLWTSHKTVHQTQSKYNITSRWISSFRFYLFCANHATTF